MRIIGGMTRGHPLKIAKGRHIRPTSAYLREVLFDVLQSRVGAATFLDLFAGSGAVGMEALSRGARGVTFVDQSAVSIASIADNLARMDVAERAVLIKADAMAAIRRLSSRGQRFSVIFVDPPYQGELLEKTLSTLSRYDLLEDEGVLIAEHFHKREMPLQLSGLTKTREIRHGETKLSFYGKANGGFEPSQTRVESSEGNPSLPR